MNTRLHRGSRGFTLVEMMVVLAIIAALTAVAIPAFVGSGAFGSDPMARTAREVQTLLRAARVYAITHNVKTAVVYNLDNYVDIETDLQDSMINEPGLEAPLRDNVTDQTIRAINAAAVMYRYPQQTWGGLRGDFGDPRDTLDEVFVPVEDNEGTWQAFDPNVVIPLIDIESTPNMRDLCPSYTSATPRYNGIDTPGGGTACAGVTVANHGMRREGVLAFIPGQGPLAAGNAPPIARNTPLVERYVAHVFNPDGSLDVSGTRQRYSFAITPRPDIDVGERLVIPSVAFLRDPSDGQVNLMHIPIDVFKASGRAKIATN